MSQLIVRGFGLSIDGFGAGPNQSLDNPLGVGGPGLMEWAFTTRTFQQMHGGGGGGGGGGDGGGNTGPDDDFAARGFLNIGAWILGRNMFGPVRGPWPDDEWKGWWGTNPPYHVPVFVLTHHAREPLVMEGGTTFYFVTDGIEAALARAREAAQGKDVRVGGGAATIRQYLRAGLVDELHIAQSSVLLGSGEALFTGIDLLALGYQVTERATTEHATHLVLTKPPRKTAWRASTADAT